MVLTFDFCKRCWLTLNRTMMYIHVLAKQDRLGSSRHDVLSYSLIISTSCSWILVNNANKDDVWLDGSARGEDWITSLSIPAGSTIIVLHIVLCPVYIGTAGNLRFRLGERSMAGGIYSEVLIMVVCPGGVGVFVKRLTNQRSLENNDRVCRSADCWDMASRLDLTSYQTVRTV